MRKEVGYRDSANMKFKKLKYGKFFLLIFKDKLRHFFSLFCLSNILTYLLTRILGPSRLRHEPPCLLTCFSISISVLRERVCVIVSMRFLVIVFFLSPLLICGFVKVKTI